MLDTVRVLLKKIMDDIDAGNSYLTEQEELETIKILQKITRKDKPLSKYQACKFLNISRATFDNLVKAGKIKEGRKVEGFKEKFWYKKDLIAYERSKAKNN